MDYLPYNLYGVCIDNFNININYSVDVSGVVNRSCVEVYGWKAVRQEVYTSLLTTTWDITAGLLKADAGHGSL